MPAKVLFFGTPLFSVPALRQLSANPDVAVVGVVTQPDQPSGRGQELTASPVKLVAQELGLPVLQPDRLRGIARNESGFAVEEKDSAATAEFAEFLSSCGAIDLGIVVAYGKIIPKTLLDLPRLGMLNIHGSLLPRWRGAAPIHRALMAGDSETGVCIMALEEGLDTGPVFSRAVTPIHDEDDFGSLHDRLAGLGADLLSATIGSILLDTSRAETQPTEGITYAEKWNRSESKLDWSEEARLVHRRIRVSSPTPGASTLLDGELVKIWRASLTTDSSLPQAAPGEVVESNRAELIVACGSNSYLSISEMQFAGRKRLPVAEVLKSRAISRGMRFNS